MGVVVVMRDQSDYHLIFRLANGALVGFVGQVIGLFAIVMATYAVRRLRGLRVPAETRLEPFAPETIGSLLFAVCLWVWASAEDKYLPGELAHCFSAELEPRRMPTEADVRWCMELIRESRADSDSEREW